MQLIFPNFDWQNPRAYASIGDVDRAGLAWEFVRRDPSYHAELSNDAIGHGCLSDGPVLVPDGEEIAHAWGLSFRGT